jgi:hypothetical protein
MEQRQWSQATYEQAIQEAGFRDFAWQPSEVAPEPAPCLLTLGVGDRLATHEHTRTKGDDDGRRDTRTAHT